MHHNGPNGRVTKSGAIAPPAAGRDDRDYGSGRGQEADHTTDAARFQRLAALKHLGDARALEVVVRRGCERADERAGDPGENSNPDEPHERSHGRGAYAVAGDVDKHGEIAGGAR